MRSTQTPRRRRLRAVRAAVSRRCRLQALRLGLVVHHGFSVANCKSASFGLDRELLGCVTGGWGGIRTHESLARLPDFKSGAFNHSATHPVSLRHAAFLPVPDFWPCARFCTWVSRPAFPARTRPACGDPLRQVPHHAALGQGPRRSAQRPSMRGSVPRMRPFHASAARCWSGRSSTATIASPPRRKSRVASPR